MDDKLLFRSGSFEIDPNGARAVRDLSEVLAQNPDINVMVEGHTDDVPYRSNGQLKDNLDLSAKRRRPSYACCWRTSRSRRAAS